MKCCRHCGTVYPQGTWEGGRTCVGCAEIDWLNPIPAANFLQPVSGGGVILIRRTIEPMSGHLALPGGFVERHETWQLACVREMLEEHGLIPHGEPVQGVLSMARKHLGIAPSDLRLYAALNYAPSPLAMFGLSPVVMDHDDLLPFVVNSEASERTVAYKSVQLAFDVQTNVTNQFLQKHWTGDHRKYAEFLSNLPHFP